MVTCRGPGASEVVRAIVFLKDLGAQKGWPSFSATEEDRGAADNANGGGPIPFRVS
jgi:hypothetical protein